MACRNKEIIKQRCDRRLSLDHPPSPQAALAELAAYAGNAATDKYGAGDIADRLESRTAALLGKPAALFLPSGKLAQMIALRILTGRAGCRRVAMHPRSHFEEYEARAYQELHGLTAAAFGPYDGLPRPADFDAITEPLGAVTVEMPLRRLGCLLSPWEDLVAIAARARSRGVALHLDGSRIWESGPYYRRPYAEIASLFDTVYVSFDKGLGALGGGAVAGPAEFIAEARIWQKRTGGRTLRMFPYLLSASKALDERLDRMEEFHRKAKSIAAALAALPGIRVTPNPPHANATLVMLEGDPGQAMEAALDVAETTGIWLFDEPVVCPIQGMSMFEITVRGATMELNDVEIRDVVARFADALATRGADSGARRIKFARGRREQLV